MVATPLTVVADSDRFHGAPPHGPPVTVTVALLHSVVPRLTVAVTVARCAPVNVNVCVSVDGYASGTFAVVVYEVGGFG